MFNTYHFEVTLFDGRIEFRTIKSESYSTSIDALYLDTRISGALLKSIKLWGGRYVISPAELYNPGTFDVPSLALI